MDDRIVPFAGCFSEDRGGRVCFAGLPSDSQSTYLRGCAGAPERIRGAYDGRCYNATTESGVDLAGFVADLGDWPRRETFAATAERWAERAGELFAAGRVPFFAGGDHAVTIPIVQAAAARGDGVHVVQIDAHPDLYPEFDGDPLSHASVAARILEMDHVVSLTQIGIRTLNASQRAVAEEHADRLFITHAMDVAPSPWHPEHIPDGAAVYLTVDLDGIDPAYAPGVSHPVPGGLSSRQVLDLIQRARWRLIGMDVVELNPSRDVNDATAVLAGRLLHEGMGTVA